jgi:hypothetical protein
MLGCNFLVLQSNPEYIRGKISILPKILDVLRKYILGLVFVLINQKAPDMSSKNIYVLWSISRVDLDQKINVERHRPPKCLCLMKLVKNQKLNQENDTILVKINS